MHAASHVHVVYVRCHAPTRICEPLLSKMSLILNYVSFLAIPWRRGGGLACVPSMPLVEQQEAAALVPQAATAALVPAQGVGHRHARKAFLVRTCELTPEKRARLLRWHRQLLAGAPLYDFWLLYDVDARCIGSTPWRTWSSPAPPNVFNYTSKAMEYAFPALRAVSSSCVPQEQRLAKPWVYHQESIALFYQRHGQRYRRYWVFEDDVDFTGDMSDFVKAYRWDSADLLSQPHAVTGSVHEPVPQHWIWSTCSTPAFAAAVPPQSRRAAAEHVQRLSHRLLRSLNAASRQGLVAHSELSVPSLCIRSNLTWRPLHPQHIGDRYQFDTRMTEDDFAAAPRGKLYHAVKPNPTAAKYKDKDIIPLADVPLDGGPLFKGVV